MTKKRKRGLPLRHVRERIDLETWELEFFEQLTTFVNEYGRKAVEQVLECMFRDGDISASLPAAWGDSDGGGGTAVIDPLTIYVRFGLGANHDKDPTYQFTLGQLVDIECKEDCGLWYAPDGRAAASAQRVALALRELADRIDKHVRTVSA